MAGPGAESITELERAAAAHWRGTEEQWLGGWLLRAAAGFTGRANSALPLGEPDRPLDEALETLASWYRARGLPPMIALPGPLEAGSAGWELDRQLARRSWPARSGPAFFMTAGLPPGLSPASPPPGTRFCADAIPDEEWLAAYHYRGQELQPPVMRSVLTSAAEQVFVSIRTADSVLAIARLSFAAGWAGITAVEVRPERRRDGLGRALTQAVLTRAAARGLNRVFLQVEVDNRPARTLYEGSGFGYSHRYHYRLAPS
ncbi:MAG TPA: GNAT family N-acetyltransferase [Trebonia sp.]